MQNKAVLYIIGGGLSVLAYTLYYVLIKNGISPRACNHIHFLGLYLSIALLFIQIKKEKEEIWFKYLICNPIIYFFSTLVFLYTLNFFFDAFVETDKPVIALILSSLISLIVYFYKKCIS
jgi:hypothetical protein